MTGEREGPSSSETKSSREAERPLRILRVAQKVYPDVTGGGAYHVHALSRDQAAMGHDVTVLTVGSGDQPHTEERAGYTVVRYPAMAEPLGNAVAPGVWRHLREPGSEQPDVVHAHSHLYASTNMAALHRRLGGPPLAITNHGLYSQTAPERVFDAYLRTAGRATFDSADVVFCYSETDRDRLRDLGVGTDVAVVENGIDTARFVPDGPTDDRVEGDLAVLFVGRLVEGKRPGDALEAAALARERTGADVRLYVAGEGPLRASMRQTARERGIAEAVTFLGHVPYDDMPALYRSVDATVLPSRSEGLPRTVLESLASGTPVVVSDLPQLAELVERGGVSVPVGHTDGFGDALGEVLADPERRTTLGRRGREYVAANHDWATTVERTTDRLRRIATD